MQTQGVSLVSAGLKNSGTSHATKVNDATFDSFMSNHAQKVKLHEQPEVVQTSKSRPENKDFLEISRKTTSGQTTGSFSKETVYGQSMTEQNVSVRSPKDEVVVEEVDVNAFAEQMTVILAQMFGMTEEEITDILEQSGIEMQSLLFQIRPDDTVSLVNVEALQQLVMDIHGIEDKSAFLTNDLLSGELSQLTEAVKELGAEILGVAPENLSDVEASIMRSFAEQLTVAGSEEQDVSVVQGNLTEMIHPISPDNEENISASGISDESSDGLQVIVENYSQSGENSGQTQDGAGNSDSDETKSESADMTLRHADTEHSEPTTATELFTERLSQAFEAITDEAVTGTESVMRNIVEQVVRQVRIRVLPETTSMELQLNPESLGKVNVHVSSTGGVATATLVVENQIAKEALESQMITLKQSFEEQGLKVDAVEVTVSEFGLKQEQGQMQNGQESRAGKHSFRENAGTGSAEETPEDTAQTAEARRDINSVVDYTA